MRTAFIVIAAKFFIPLLLFVITAVAWLLFGRETAARVNRYLRQEATGPVAWRVLGHGVFWGVVGIVGCIALIAVIGLLSAK